MKTRISAMLVIAVLATAIPALAQDFEPPADTDLDWVQLTSGEWLKGKIVRMYEGSLEFASEGLGSLEIGWGSVRQLRSKGVVQVGARDREVLAGTIVVDEETVRIEGDTTAELPRSEVLTLIAGEPREANFWSSKVTLGANFRSGNVDQTVYNTWARALRRTTRSRIALEYLGNYNETDDVESSNNHRATGKWDLFLSERLFFSPVDLEWYKDPFLNIDQRWTLGVGLGYVLVDRGRTYWSVSAGPGYQYIEFAEVAPGEDDSSDSFAFLGGTRLTYDLTGAIDFSYDYRFSILDEASGSYTHHMVAGFTIDLTNRIDLDVAWVWDRVQDPTPDADGVLPEQDDYQMILGVGLNF